ncbi:MAG: sigma 54-interacting transcriptional regulator [Nitrospiria bacterium]
MANLRIYLKEEFRWSYTLLDREIEIGRSRESHIVLPHPEVSRHHALIIKEGKQFIAIDRSENGLDINHNFTSKTVLNQGDVLHIGAFRLVFEAEDAGDMLSDTMTWESTVDLALSKRPKESDRKYELVVTSGPDEGKRIPLRKGLIRVGRSVRADFVLSDKTISNLHLEIETSASGPNIRDMGSTNGTCVNGQKIQSLILDLGSEIQIGETILKIFLEEGTLPVPSFPRRLIGQSPKIEEIYRLIKKGSKGDIAILIQGETGTGKELVAQEIHRLSRRQEGPFITVDCSAIPRDLIESELFGHEKGSFTGATAQRRGAFELADGGTIFLDEVGELPLDLQPKLLRVLEEKQYKRIGGSERFISDFRIITATNRWLDQEVLQGNFRQDLFFRLYIFPIFIPTLRERRADIPLLVEHFLKGKWVTLPQEVLDLLMVHPWPGNVRELRNVMERAVVMMEGTTLKAEDLLFLSSEGKGSPPMFRGKNEHLQEAGSLEEIEEQVIKRTLEEHGGDKKAVARILGIALSTLYEKLRRYKMGE